MLSCLKSGDAAEEGVGILQVCICVHPMCTRVCVQAPQPSQANSVGTHLPWATPTTLNNNKPGFLCLVAPDLRGEAREPVLQQVLADSTRLAGCGLG